MKKIMILFTAMLVLFSSACGSKNETSAEDVNVKETVSDGSKTESGTHVITDHAGRKVTVPNEVDRVVICDIYPLPSIISVFFDSADKIVGMAEPSMAAAKNSLLSELFPEILNAKTDFIDGTSVNIEELLMLEPDVVFFNAGNKALGEQLENAGFAAVAISAGKWQYDAVETLIGWIGTLDQIFPDNSRTELVQQYSDQIREEVGKRIEAIPEEARKSVFFLFQYTDETLQTNGNPSFGSYWAEAIGAENVVAEPTEQNARPVSMEQIMVWEPDVIFITNFTAAKPEDLYQNTIGTYDWSAVKAVKDGQVYKMPLGMYRTYTSGIDTPIALMWLSKACYPEYFEDVDITALTEAYYKDVFGVELTDDQASSIFDPSAGAGELGLSN